jgi:hypothetical protein
MARSSRTKSDGCGADAAGRWAAAGRTPAGQEGVGTLAAGSWFALSIVAILNSLSIWFAYFAVFLRWDKYV